MSKIALHTAKSKKEGENGYIFYVEVNPRTASLGRKARHSPSPAAESDSRLTLFGCVLALI